MERFLFGALVVLFMPGCALGLRDLTPVEVSVPFDPAAYTAWQVPGTASVTGKAAVQSKLGGLVSCAGYSVFLMPKSPYFDETAAIIKSGRLPDVSSLAGPDSPVRSTRCDGDGNFRFEKLPAAQWYVFTGIHWSSGPASQGRDLVEPVTTTEGQTTTVLMVDKAR